MHTIELIRLRLLMHAHTFDELQMWMRKHRPRVLPEAVGVLLFRLRHEGRARIIKGRWEVCRPVLHMPLGPALRAPNVGICEECGSPGHETTDCHQLRRAIERRFPERQENPIAA